MKTTNNKTSTMANINTIALEFLTTEHKRGTFASFSNEKIHAAKNRVVSDYLHRFLALDGLEISDQNVRMHVKNLTRELLETLVENQI